MQLAYKLHTRGIKSLQHIHPADRDSIKKFYICLLLEQRM